VNWRITLPLVGGAILILIAVGIFRACNSRKTRDPLENVPPAVYQPQKNNSRSTLPVPTQQPRR
jgi:hypothetical protein